MPERKKSEVVFKVFFILMLVFLLLGSIVYIPLKLSLTTAEQQEVPPTLFGKMFIPYTVDGEDPYSQIASGSLVFFESPADKAVQEGIVVLYPTPDGGREQNVVFGGYSMGMVATMNDTADIGKTYGIMIGNDPNLDLETIAATSVVGVGSSTIKQMAYVFHFVTSTLGLVVLVLNPLVFGVLFLFLFLVMRGKRKQADLASTEEPVSSPQSEPAPKALQNLAIDQTLLQQETASLLLQPDEIVAPQSHLIPPNTNTDALQQPIQIAPLQSSAPTEDDASILSSTTADSPTQPIQMPALESLESLSPSADVLPSLSITVPPQDAGESAPLETEVTDLTITPSKQNRSDNQQHNPDTSLNPPNEEGDAMDHQQNFFNELRELNNQAPPVDNTLDDEAFLAKIEEDLNRIEQESQSYTSLPSAVLDPPEGLEKASELPAASAEVTPDSGDNTIVFLLKDDEIDVKFNNLISNKIDVDYHKDGSGFLIKTPKYQADITVVVSEQ